MDNLKNEILDKLNENESEYINNLIDKMDNINQYRRTYYQNNKIKIKNYQKIKKLLEGRETQQQKLPSSRVDALKQPRNKEGQER